MSTARQWAILFITGMLLGCGSSQAPVRQATEAKSAIRAAETVRAESQPTSALHLKMARDQASTADKLSQDGENDEANLMYQRAEADAEMAVALIRTQQARTAAMQAQQKTDELRQGQQPGGSP